MMHAADFITHARNLVSRLPEPLGSDPTEIELRRALSSAYYGVFHRLTNAGSMRFAAGGDPLRFQAARAFSHATMRKVCDAYVRSPTRPFPPGLEHLNTSVADHRLIEVARAFARLQEGCHTADYDLSAAIGFDYVAQLVAVAETALADFERIETFPETTVFLTALLLADRWTRHG